MYRRYTPSPPPEKPFPQNGGSTAGQTAPPVRHNSRGSHGNYRQGGSSRPPQGMHYNSHRNERASQSSSPMPVRERVENKHNKDRQGVKNPRSMLFGLLPPSIYNRENKKILGFLSSEDLLLVALIFLFLEREDEDQMIILVLLYILLSDYIDLPFDL